MNVFNYMETDSEMLNDLFDELTENYSEWAQDRVFEQSKNALAGVKGHFQKEEMVINNLKDQRGLEQPLAEAKKERDAIVSEIEQLVMIHVDEPGFEQGLESIATKFKNHRKFSLEKLYPLLKERLSSSDMHRISEQLEQRVLSGKQRTD